MYSAITAIRGNGELKTVPRKTMGFDDDDILILCRSPNVKTRGFVGSNTKRQWRVPPDTWFYKLVTVWASAAHQIEGDTLFPNFSV